MNLENRMEPTGEMTPEQHGAIQHAVRIGSLLVNDHPEIAELYRNGMSHPEIAENLDVKRVMVFLVMRLPEIQFIMQLQAMLVVLAQSLMMA